MHTGYDVVVLAGGAARRFGSDKLALLLDVVLEGLPDDVGTIVCVGPERPTRRVGVRWTREQPPMGGPLAAVAAGAALTTSDAVVLLGGDMPDVGRGVPALVAAVLLASTKPAVLLDGAGRPQLLASAWPRPALLAALSELEPTAGRPLRALLDGVDPIRVADAWGAARDVDVPADLTEELAPGGPASPG